MIRVTIWNEFFHEATQEDIKAIYPEGIHAQLAKALKADDLTITTAWLEKDAEHGLSQEVLDNTDVLIWWGHCRHNDVRDDVAARVVARVHAGMGFVPLHSAHMSKPFRALMGTPCTLHWREAGECARIWTVAPNHPVTKGIPLEFKLDHEEMYSEFFAIPQPDELVFISWYKGGNVFRSGCAFTRCGGRIFYFQPGHESYPNYYDPNVIKVIGNAVRWAAPTEIKDLKSDDWVPPLEKLDD